MDKKIESITIDGNTYQIEQMSDNVKRIVKTYENTLEKARKAEEEALVFNAACQQIGPAIVNAVREEAAKALKQAQATPAPAVTVETPQTEVKS